MKIILLDILLNNGFLENLDPIVNEFKDIGGASDIKAKNIKKLTKSKKLDFIKVNFFKIDFHISEA